jgi:putative addiction module component (TIGR02574 family)
MSESVPDYDFSALSTSARLMLAQELLDSVHFEGTPLSPEQDAEIKRRVHRLDSGETICEPWDSLYARLMRRA